MVKRENVSSSLTSLSTLFASKLGGGTSTIAQVYNNTKLYDHLSVEINLREIIVISNNDNDVS